MSGVLIILSPRFSQDAGKQEQLGHASRATQDRKQQTCQAAHGHAGFSVNSRVRVDVISARHLIGVKCLPVRRSGRLVPEPSAKGFCRVLVCSIFLDRRRILVSGCRV